MSTNAKIAWAVVIILLIAAGFTWFAKSNTSTSAPANVTPTASGNSVPVSASAVQSQPTQVLNASDESIDADMSSIDRGLKDLTSDSANVDQGLNDQPISQTQ